MYAKKGLDPGGKASTSKDGCPRPVQNDADSGGVEFWGAWTSGGPSLDEQKKGGKMWERSVKGEGEGEGGT